MTAKFAAFLAAGALAGSGFAAEKSIQMKDLPPAVQSAVQEQLRGADIKGVSMEKEKGATIFEVESMVNGKHKDLAFNASGSVVEAEDEIAIDAAPAPAKAAIMTKVGTRKLEMVETVTKGKTMYYEAHYTTKGGRKLEALVTADGSKAKD